MSQKKERETTTSPWETKEIIANITKEYGEGIITTLGESKFREQKTLSTGSFILDQAIGGGYPFGRVIEIYGQEASGKTTLALHAVSECQKLGKRAVYMDVENALNAKHAKNIGVDIDELIVLHPEYGEQAFRLLIDLIRGGAGLVVIDSVAALIPKCELEGDLEKQMIGSHARMIANGLKQINNELTNRDTIIIFINQTRNKISTSFFVGSSETTTGGVALKYYASLRIKLREREKIEKGNEYIGIRVHALVKKNKLTNPYKERIIEIIFARGIQKEREMIDLATELNILQKSGSWYSYQEKKIGQGKENVVDYLIENPETYQSIEKEVREKLENRLEE